MGVKVSINKKEISWWQSKTIWAALATAIIAGVSAYAGVENVWVSVLTAVFSALGIYGRATADAKVKLG